jgi:uncharacterized protein (TIGR02145 family)
MKKLILRVVNLAVITALVCMGCVGDGIENDNGEADGFLDRIYNPNCGTDFRTVTIGNQTWMAENLNCYVAGSTCYSNSADSCAKYGLLYTWYAAMSACPVGWHLPSDAEWTELTDFVGGSSTAGTKLKSTTYYWGLGIFDISNEYGCRGTDDYGFSALPGGGRLSGFNSGPVDDAGYTGTWWSATEFGTKNAWYRSMMCEDVGIYRNYGVGRYNYPKSSGMFSVRCVKD